MHCRLRHTGHSTRPLPSPPNPLQTCTSMAKPNPKPVPATVPVDSSDAAGAGGKASEEGVIPPLRWQPAEAPGLYRLLVESVVDYAIFALDSTGHIRTWNQGAQRIKGYTAEEIIGKHFSVFYPLEDRLAGKPERELEIAIAAGRV